MAEVDGERRLRIALEPAGPDRIALAVEDTGPGIPPDLVGRVFDPFVTTKGVHGTGLGLSISYGIVREHGGQISVESGAGRGARFTVELPVGAPAAEPAPATPGPAPRLEGRRILVVEEDGLVADVLTRHLERAGCETLAVGTAEEALARLGEAVHLVISDFYLPGMSGLALYREAVRRYPALARRSLFVTGGAIPDAAQSILGTERVPLLPKPFSRDQLLRLVGDALG